MSIFDAVIGHIRGELNSYGEPGLRNHPHRSQDITGIQALIANYPPGESACINPNRRALDDSGDNSGVGVSCGDIDRDGGVFYHTHEDDESFFAGGDESCDGSVSCNDLPEPLPRGQQIT